MSPEQIQGIDVDHRADIFSLGVLLYEMTTGTPPFRGEHDAAVMYEIVNVQPRDPAELKPGTNPELVRIISKCLAKDPEDRYHSAKDIAVDLRVLSRHSGSSPQQGTPQPGSKSRVSQTGRMAGPAAGAAGGMRKFLPIGAGTLVLALIAGWYFFGRDQAGTIGSMVVLPFENVGADPDLEYLSDGVTEGIINKFSKLPDFRVIPRSAAFRYKGSPKDPQSIGKELGVDAVLSGRVVQRGDKLDLTLELLDVGQYSQVWGENYKRTMDDLITVQDEIVREVSERLKPGSTGSAVTAEQAQTENPAAYRLYLQGKFHWNKRTAADLDRALDYFNQAIQLDRNFARAHLGIAETCLLQGEYADDRSAETVVRAEAEAKRALELDPTLGEAHAALAGIHQREWDWSSTEREYRLAIEKSPGYATSYHWYSIHLLSVGRNDESFDIIRKGAELDPYSPIILVNLAEGYILKNDLLSADEVIGRALELDPGFFWANIWRAKILGLQGKKKNALDIVDGWSVSSLPSIHQGFVGHHYAVLGEEEKAISILNALLNDQGKAFLDPVAVAMIYAGLGNADNTMAWLQTAFDQEQKSTSLPMTRGWTEFRFVHNDPRYLELLRKMGL